VSADTILKELDQTKYGEYIIVIHSRITTLSKIFPVTKNRLVNNNEIILLLPHYETLDSVKRNLSESNGTSRIEIQKHEKEGSLVTVDGVKAHFNFKLDTDHLSED
jgi:hypothetical protein